MRAGRGAVTVEARRRAPAGPIGLGLTASKKVGNAVLRNRARRRLREAARRLLPEFGVAGVDYVLVARQSTPDADWAALLDDLKSALIRLAADLETGAKSERRSRAQSPHQRDTPTESE
jgi:ribonuclease P protein component